MMCAEHTLQLGIRDVLKKGRAKKFLTKLRKLALHLRLPHTDGILKRHANKEIPHASAIGGLEIFCLGSWLT